MSVEAIVTLEKGRDCYLWIVKKCPYCEKKHTHGGGKLNNDPRELLGHRLSHCFRYPKADYKLVEK